MSAASHLLRGIRAKDAASRGDIEFLRKIIEGYWFDVRTKIEGNTLIHWSAQNGHTECIRYLVTEAGADPNQRVPKEILLRILLFSVVTLNV